MVQIIMKWVCNLFYFFFFKKIGILRRTELTNALLYSRSIIYIIYIV